MQLRRAILPASVFLLLVAVLECTPTPIAELSVIHLDRLAASALPTSDSLREVLIERDEAVWRISLVGSAKWIKEVSQHELNSYAIVVRCDAPDQNVFSLGPYVGQVLVTYEGEHLVADNPRYPSARYDIYVPETGRYRSTKDFNARMPTYDLGKQRIALCIRIAGGAMSGAYGRSNEVRVEVGKKL